MKGLRRMTIEELVNEAYDIGHAHGTNPYRQLEGKRAQRVNDGWGRIAKEIERRFRELKKVQITVTITTHRTALLDPVLKQFKRLEREQAHRTR